jgi:transcriptional regulator with XRE-family HTH domain
MIETHTLAYRLRARADQLGLAPAHVAEMAGVNRSFVYDILRGRSVRPSIDRLADVARVLKVDRDWLIHGIGEVEGPSPFVENPDDAFVAIAHAAPRPAMGGGTVVTEDGDTPGRAYHFRQSWIRQKLKASPSQLRIMHVEGDSMAPTACSGTCAHPFRQHSPTCSGVFAHQ